MQLSDCEVQLSGDMRNTVLLTGVTPAEIVVLRIIHGADAVINVFPRRQNNRPHAEEKQNLIEKYRKARADIESAFPGIDPKLPVHLKDIGITDVGETYTDEVAEERQPVKLKNQRGVPKQGANRKGHKKVGSGKRGGHNIFPDGAPTPVVDDSLVTDQVDEEIDTEVNEEA